MLASLMILACLAEIGLQVESGLDRFAAIAETRGVCAPLLIHTELFDLDRKEHEYLSLYERVAEGHVLLAESLVEGILTLPTACFASSPSITPRTHPTQRDHTRQDDQ